VTGSPGAGFCARVEIPLSSSLTQPASSERVRTRIPA